MPFDKLRANGDLSVIHCENINSAATLVLDLPRGANILAKRGQRIERGLGDIRIGARLFDCTGGVADCGIGVEGLPQPDRCASPRRDRKCITY